MKQVSFLGLLIAILTIFTSMTSVFASQELQKVDKIVLATPFSPLAMPMAYIVENGLLRDVARKVELVVWNNPDQLRAMVTQGQADFVSIPSNVASIFYNKGVKLKLLRVSVWGIFYIVSGDPNVKSLSDMKGQRVLVPFRGDQPDLMFQFVCKGQGLDPFKDYEVQYVNSPLDITMSLLSGEARNGFMIEPAATVAIMKAAQKGLTLRRVVDIQNEWGRLTGMNARFPNAGVVCLPHVLKNASVVEAFEKAYDEAVKWSTNHPEESGALAAQYVKGVPAAAFTESLKYTILQSVTAQASKNDLVFLFSEFLKMNPSSVGGSLPDDNFYFK